MKYENIKSYYLNFIDREVSTFDTETKTSVHSNASKFLDFIFEYPNKRALVAIDYQTIIQEVESEDTKQIDYTLHLLALKPYDVIEWVTYFEDDDNRRYDFTKLDIIEMSQNNEFINPFTDDELTKEEFSEYLNTVFRLTNSFLKRLEIA